MPKLKFKFKITLIQGMRVTTFRINSKRLKNSEIEAFQSPSNPNEYEGEIETICIKDTVIVSVWGVGIPFLQGSFNITQNGNKLFSEDQKLSVKSKGRFRFYKVEVKLP
ncbi:hypothetical protein [uncultured Tenacibaculum sp.]|uniref:hypothetical protein n=1 Tax=uncultured Tenacibaculum sp. TaxID=174713 RepID=UPI00261029DA|nr:hypothetical protein [uncultured Tenacibaculum sp.]